MLVTESLVMMQQGNGGLTKKGSASVTGKKKVSKYEKAQLGRQIKNKSEPTLKQLFKLADRVGSKYQT